MIYEVKYSSKFKRNYKLAKKRGMDVKLLEEIVDKIRRRIPLEKRYKDHELQGRYKEGTRAFGNVIYSLIGYWCTI